MNSDRRIIFRCKSGSHLYGLNRPDSDLDYFTVFMPNSYDLLGLSKTEELDKSTKSSGADRRNTSEDIDDKWYTLPRYLHLLLQNNPNIVETLFAPKDVTDICEPEFQFLVDNYEKIISQRIFHSFSGYAYAQKSKLITKKERYESLGKALEWFEHVAFMEAKVLNLYNTLLHDSSDFLFWRPITEEESVELNSRLKYYKGAKNNCESFHQGMDLGMIYRKIRREYEQYGWRVKTESFLKLGMDTKFAYHLIRLLAEGVELTLTGKIVFPISGQAREDILRIRNSEVEYNELLEMYKRYDDYFQSIKDKSVLCHHPDFNWANDWLIATLKESLAKE